MNIEQETVVVSQAMERYEAELIKTILDAGGVEVFLFGNEVRVRLKEEAKALELLSELQSNEEIFVCPECNEEAPPGFGECPMCEALRPAAEQTSMTIAEYAEKTELTAEGRAMKRVMKAAVGVVAGGIVESGS